MLTDDADLTRGGRLFQGSGPPSTGNALSSYIGPIRQLLSGNPLVTRL